MSIIIVNYNGGDLLLSCLDSILQYPPSCEYEVILIDNESTDGSVDLVPKNYPTINFIQNSENIGLAQAFNKGLGVAKGELVLSLDNDTRLTANSIDELVRVLESTPDIGAVGSRVVNPDFTDQKTARRSPSAINAVFGRRSLISRIWPTNPISSRYLMDDKQSESEVFDVDWVSTAALAVRKSVIEQVGGLDPGFFVYWVDAEWCARIRQGSWRIACVPSSVIVHDENLKAKRRNRKSSRMIMDFHRGAYRYYSKVHCKNKFGVKRAVAWVGLFSRAYLILAVEEVLYRIRRYQRQLPD